MFSILFIPLLRTCAQKNNIHDKYISYEYTNSNETNTNEGCLTLFIADGLTEPFTQVIQCSKNTLKHGFATVPYYLFDQIELTDLIWEPDFEINGIKYPIKERRLNLKEIETISNFIFELDTISPAEFYGDREEYLYVLYINNRKVLTVTEDLIEQPELPIKYRTILKNVISMAKPLYPNFGLLLDIH